MEPRLEAKDELRHVSIIDEERYTSIGTTMAAVDAELIHQALKKNVDLFAWTAAEVPGVNPEVITYRLSVYKEARPVAQKKINHGEKKEGSWPKRKPRSSWLSGSFERPGILLGWRRGHGHQIQRPMANVR